ncbi:major facilitator superfamily domain-containing protein [Ilyonectria sp. MPI-CAGE-AT-0026]|nr:major facilitator superfamily domain-containing protein [Ilyonectria sp. MPI-CAGE-AT-0026]
MYNQQDSRLQLATPDTRTTVFDGDAKIQALTPSSITTAAFDGDFRLQTLTPSSTTTAVFDGDLTLKLATFSSTTTLVSDGEAGEKSIPDAQPSVSPSDHGKDAWLFLAACFFVDALAWGFPNSFGVFQEYYSGHALFAGSAMIPVIGTCTLGIMYLTMPLIMGFQRLYPRFGRWSPVIGLSIMSISLGIGSYSQTTTHLMVSQGIFFAIGSSILYCPCLLYLEEWFIERRGLAFGGFLSGTGLSGSVLPLLLEHFLGRHGFRTTLRIWAVSLVVLTVPLAYFIKPRLPTASTSHLRPFRFGFALNRTFILFQASNIFQALGYSLLLVYLPTYARAIGASHFLSAFTLVLVNFASMVGCAGMGVLTDRYHVTVCFLISAVGSTLSTFLVWGFATEIPTLFFFCVLYGLFAGSYPSAWPGIPRHMSQSTTQKWNPHNDGQAGLDSTMVLGVLSIGRGIGSTTSGPLSHALINGLPWFEEVYGGYGTGYGPLIVVSGVCAIISGMSVLWWKLKWI